jgi:hypothetical protein
MSERRKIDEQVRKDKLEVLADAWGMDAEELLETYGLDSIVPGICTNEVRSV